MSRVGDYYERVLKDLNDWNNPQPNPNPQEKK